MITKTHLISTFEILPENSTIDWQIILLPMLRKNFIRFLASLSLLFHLLFFWLPILHDFQ